MLMLCLVKLNVPFGCLSEAVSFPCLSRDGKIRGFVRSLHLVEPFYGRFREPEGPRRRSFGVSGWQFFFQSSRPWDPIHASKLAEAVRI